jgi:hypothetical protein
MGLPSNRGTRGGGRGTGGGGCMAGGRSGGEVMARGRGEVSGSWPESKAKGEVGAGVEAEGEGEAEKRSWACSRPEVRERLATGVPRGGSAAGDGQQGRRRSRTRDESRWRDRNRC